MGEGLKELLLHKVSVRLIYLVAAFGSTRFISVIASEDTQAFLSHAGVSFQITNPDMFKMWVQLSLMGLGEFIFHFIHTKLTPVVKPQSTPPPEK